MLDLLAVTTGTKAPPVGAFGASFLTRDKGNPGSKVNRDKSNRMEGQFSRNVNFSLMDPTVGT